MTERAAVSPPALVTASAGTGKTYWIVERVKSLLVDEGASLDQIGVITFTEAAAAELRARIAAALKAIGHPAADEVAGAAITTINGFALGLVKRYALVMGLGAAVETLDEAGAAGLRAQALNHALEDPAHAERVVHLKEALGVRTADEVRQTIFGLLEKSRSLRLDAQGLAHQAHLNAAMLAEAFGPAGDAQALDATLRAAFGELDALLPRTGGLKTDAPVVAGFDEALRALGRGELRKAAALAAKLKKATKRVEPLVAPMRAAAGAWLRAHPLSLAYLQATSEAVYTLAGAAAADYGARKAALGCLDFSDQIARALELLERDAGGVPLAAVVAAEMPYLLVDEFQDTSPLQFRLAESLREHGCQVSYVGDLKQAIYGWRDADSRLMGALLARAHAEARAPHTLDRNWRSRPELVAFCNDLFAPVFARLGLAFEPVTPARDAVAGGDAGPCVELLMQNKAFYPKPEMIVGRLRELVAGGRRIVDRDSGALRAARWGDVAILERRGDQLDEWAAALSAAGIPFDRELGGWSARAEVRGAIAWLRCLANPHDSAALATVLCSEYFGLGAEELGALALAGLFRAPVESLMDDGAWGAIEAAVAEPLARMTLRRFREAWRTASRQVRRPPLTAGVRAALGAIDAELVLASKPDAVQRQANVTKLVELAARIEGMGTRALGMAGLSGATLEDFVAWLAGVPDSDDDVQPLVARRGGEAVQLLTMHRAKGLEFPIVLVPRMPFDVGARPARCEVSWPADADAFLGAGLFGRSRLRFVPPHPEVGDLRVRLGQAEADAGAAVDEACLLYVVFTRARDYLMVGWTPNARVGSAQELLGVDLAAEALAGHAVRVTPCGPPGDGDGAVEAHF